MVDVNRLRSRMVLMGYNQRSLVAEMNARGVKTTENTFSSKMNGKSQFDCDDADVICDILEVEQPAERAEMFLVYSYQFCDMRRLVWVLRRVST